jgi:hypothetical protein
LANKADWWTDNWDKLTGVQFEGSYGYFQVVPPTAFKDCSQSDAMVIEESIRRTGREVVDGVEIERSPGRDDDLVRPTVELIWSNIVEKLRATVY